jgi:hypothetical protein
MITPTTQVLMTLRRLPLLGLLLLAPALAAQTSPPPDGPGSRLLVDVTFHSQTYEPIRIFLASGRKYRAQVTEPNLILQVRSYEGKQLPMVVSVNLGADASGRSDVELRPRVDGEFELSPIYVYAGRPVRFQLWALPLPDEVPAKVATPVTGGLEFGLELSAGSHGEFQGSLENYGEAGTSLTACGAFRGVGGVAGRLWGCAVGVEVEEGATDGNFTYVYTEPRFRFLGGAGGFPIEGGVVLRLDFGDAKDGRGAGKYGFGLYAGYQQWRTNGGGLTLIGSLISFRVNASDPNASGASAWSGNLGLGYFF